MAVGGVSAQSVLGKLSKDHLECSICTNNFTNPKVLDCQHTFCFDCLQELVDRQNQSSKTIPCPLCRQNTTLPERGVAGLTANLTISALVDEVNAQTQALERRPLRQADPQCKQHFKQSLEFYCNTCAQLFCKTCRLEHRRFPTHYVVGLPQASDQCRREVAELVGKAVKQNTEFTIALNQTEKSIATLKVTYAAAKDKISTKAEEEINRIKEEALKLNQEAETVFKNRFETFKMALSTNSSYLTRAEDKLDEVKQLMTKGSCVEILDLKQHVLDNLKDLTEKQPRIESDQLSFLDFEEEGERSLGRLLEVPKLATKDETEAVQPPLFDYVPPLVDYVPPRVDYVPPLVDYVPPLVDYVPPLVDYVPVQTALMKKGKWILKTEIKGEIYHVCNVGAFSNNTIVASDIDRQQFTTFLPFKNKYERDFKIVLWATSSDGLSVNSNNELVVLYNGIVAVYNDAFDILFRFRPGKGPNKNPTCIAVNDEDIIAVGYGDRGKISLHSPDGRFIKMLRAPGVGRYLTFNKHRLIYTDSSNGELVSLDSMTGDTVFTVDIETGKIYNFNEEDSDSDDSDSDDSPFCTNDIQPAGVCCDIDGSIYVAWQRESGYIDHFSSNGKYTGLTIKGCGFARNITITPGGELVVAAVNTVKVYHRV